MANEIPKRNPDGYRDPTAHDAMSAVQGEQDDADRRAKSAVYAVKIMLDLAGFDLLERIEIRDRKTGRYYR